jgi:DNA-binding transcriptional ArsR family regulator
MRTEPTAGRQQLSQVHELLVFDALADPVRRELLMRLAAHSPKTATQLAADYPITRQGILKHLTILEHARLVVVHQVGREKRYTITLEPLSDVQQFIKELGETWDRRLLRLKELLENEEQT